VARKKIPIESVDIKKKFLFNCSDFSLGPKVLRLEKVEAAAWVF
jgi:hypothetical protein